MLTRVRHVGQGVQTLEALIIVGARDTPQEMVDSLAVVDGPVGHDFVGNISNGKVIMAEQRFQSAWFERVLRLLRNILRGGLMLLDLGLVAQASKKHAHRRHDSHHCSGKAYDNHALVARKGEDCHR